MDGYLLGDVSVDVVSVGVVSVAEGGAVTGAVLVVSSVADAVLNAAPTFLADTDTLFRNLTKDVLNFKNSCLTFCWTLLLNLL